MESEELDLHLEPGERWVRNGMQLGEYVGLHIFPAVRQSVDVDMHGAGER